MAATVCKTVAFWALFRRLGRYVGSKRLEVLWKVGEGLESLQPIVPSGWHCKQHECFVIYLPGCCWFWGGVFWENFKLSWLPDLALVTKVELFVPWGLEFE